MKRAVHDRQFKMAQAEAHSVHDTEKELGVSASSLRSWINK
ncbi:hypothetical protein KL86CLO1_11378 [uncultured Eubacteriales bacterium]|uniref:Transposase n=1 Tax=uncultured Eubacteriales bacterium TaxID=172733 RepID=A0A212JMR8_9FIRM|nr:hypothetical protein KL86CLO1_11378 [uncultured Eubacteriales bacterium]